MYTLNWNGQALALLTGLLLLACGSDDTSSMQSSAKSLLSGFGKLKTDSNMEQRAAMAMASMPVMSGAMCALPPDSSPCDRCIVNSCGTACDRCASDSNCPAAAQCIAECTDASCINGCGSAATLDKVTALTGCVLDRCTNDCSADLSSSCEACAQAECSPAFASCGRDPNCIDVLNCCMGTEAACTACIESAPPSTVNTLQQLVQCLQGCGCG